MENLEQKLKEEIDNIANYFSIKPSDIYEDVSKQCVRYKETRKKDAIFGLIEEESMIGKAFYSSLHKKEIEEYKKSLEGKSKDEAENLMNDYLQKFFTVADIFSYLVNLERNERIREYIKEIKEIPQKYNTLSAALAIYAKCKGDVKKVCEGLLKSKPEEAYSFISSLFKQEEKEEKNERNN